MRLRNDDVFTRPVLKEISDDFSSTFKVNFNLETTRNSLELSYEIELNSEVFMSYCLSDKVKIGLHLYSPSIVYRKFIEIELEDLEGVISLKRDDLYGKVEISPLLIANEDFTLSANEELEDIDDDNYGVKKGMVLGYAETVELEVDYSMTNLNDLVVIQPVTDREQSNVIEIQAERIIYYLYNQEYNSYEELYSLENSFAQKLIKIVHNAIYTRLLYYVLEVRDNGEEAEFEATSVYEFINQVFESKYPENNIYEISTDLINKYAVELSEISFVDITVEGDDEDE